MISFKISSEQLTYLHKWASEITESCGCSCCCCCKETTEDVREAIEKAYHSISQGHTEHELTLSDGAVAFMHDGLTKYQHEHKDHMNNETKEMISSLIKTFSC